MSRWTELQLCQVKRPARSKWRPRTWVPTLSDTVWTLQVGPPRHLTAVIEATTRVRGVTWLTGTRGQMTISCHSLHPAGVARNPGRCPRGRAPGPAAPAIQNAAAFPKPTTERKRPRAAGSPLRGRGAGRPPPQGRPLRTAAVTHRTRACEA